MQVRGIHVKAYYNCRASQEFFRAPVTYAEHIDNGMRAEVAVPDCQGDSASACGNGTWARDFSPFWKKCLVIAKWPINLLEMALEPFETAEAQGLPTVRQQSVFVENTVGQLLRLARLFDHTEVRILAVSVVYAVDCAICRLIVDDPDRAHELLTEARFQVSETELLVVCLPPGKRALLHTWATLLGGEINMFYTYPLLVRPKGLSAIAVLPDSMEQAVSVLRERGFTVLDQQDLMDVRLE